MSERLALHRQPTVYSTFIDGTQSSHIKRRAVRADSAGFKVHFIFHHQDRVHFVKRYVPSPCHEAHEAVQYGSVLFGCPFPTYIPQPGYQTVGKRDEASCRVCTELPQDIASRIFPTCTFKSAHDFVQYGHIPENAGFKFFQVYFTGRGSFWRYTYFRTHAVPFFLKDPVAGRQLAYFLFMYYTISQCTFLRRNRRNAESYFYCCHNRYCLKQ